MALHRRTIRVQNPELPQAFNDRQRVLAVVVRAALAQAGYRSYFLGGSNEGAGLAIGASCDSAIDVSYIKEADMRRFTFAHAQACAAKLNGLFQRATKSTEVLVTVRRGTTNIGAIPYAEVVVRIPRTSTLNALCRAFTQ